MPDMPEMTVATEPTPIALPLLPATAALIAARNRELAIARAAEAAAEQRLFDSYAVFLTERGLDVERTQVLELTPGPAPTLIVQVIATPGVP